MEYFVWPAFKTLTAVTVVVALMKIAFFPSQGDGTTADVPPGYAVDVKTVPVTKGSTSNTISVRDHIVQDATIEVQVDLVGMVDPVTVEKDTQVNTGDPLLYIKHSESQPPVTKTNEGGNVTQTPIKDKVTRSMIYTSVSGTVTPKVLKQQETDIDVVVATITPAIYPATGTVNAVQQHRLASAPIAATLAPEGGPAPFQCNNLKIGIKASTSTTTGGDSSATITSGDGTNVEMCYAVPDSQKVSAGMLVTISVDAGSASEALMAPVTTVEGKVGLDFVWLVPESGDASRAVRTTVKPGIMNDTNIQITASLKADQQVLQFVPNKGTRRTGTLDACEPDNSACYDSEGKEIL